jgi:predicted NACHT family NTPase
MLAMNTKKEQNIREIAQRFEVILSGFVDSTKDKERGFNETYFRQVIAKATYNYAKIYLEDHAFTKLFGSSKLPSLSSIYIPQRFQASKSIRSFESVEELEEAFSRDLQRSNYSKGNNLLGLNIANEEDYLTILGQPATGKTTFLKYIGLEALRHPRGRYKHDVLPVFIQMWKFCRSADTILQAIAEEFEKCGFPESRELAIWVLEQGKLLILIDGLNEATLSQKYLSKHLRDFVNSYPQNRYIVSSRLASYQNSLGQFLELELQCWHDLHVQEYIHKWFAIAYEPKTSRGGDDTNPQSPKPEQDLASIEAQRCWQILQTNTVARQLANSPLSLSLLCLLSNHRYSFPSNVSSLYKKAIDLVLEEQVLQCQLINNEGKNSLSTDILDILLTEIAYRGFELCQPFFSFDEMTEWIQTSLNNCAGILQKLEVDFILKVLQQIGICKIVSSGTFSSFIFSHITFQEYFVARYIYNHNKVRQLVPNHLSDRRWQQVFLLLAGMMVGNTEELLLCIESQASDYINTAKLRDILDWLEQITINSKGKLKNVAKRIATLFLARPRFLTELETALVLTRMLGLTRDLYENFDSSLDFDKVFASDLSMSLSHALDFDSTTELNLTIQLCGSLEQALAKIEFDQRYINFTVLNTRLEALNAEAPSYEQPFEVREAFRNKISRTWLQALYLPADLNQISQQEVEALKNYLYANLLMVRCKNMAIVVSLKTWEEIESRMLRINP